MAKKPKPLPHEKSGPKPIEINWSEFDKLCFIQSTLREIASWFDCSEDTIENRVKQTHGIRFSEYYEQKRGKGKVSIRRKQYEVAMSGDKTMLIWLGKQYLGQSDKFEVEHDIETETEFTKYEEKNQTKE
jgi:hypothetical protein